MIKNITNVRGVKCWGAHIGVKSLRRDLAIIYSKVPASAAAVFTQNQVVAEPIKVSRQHIQDGKAQVIVINAGNANACTGQAGQLGAQAMVQATAAALEIDPELVLVASTGVIGKPFPTDEVVKGIHEIAPKLSNKSKAGSFTANAILTTDTFAKEGFLEFTIDGRNINMGGIAKGSGMIHPNMATMLAFIVTDLAIDSELLQRTVKKVVDKTFNMITVDGDTSTNDMVAVLANGLAENDLLSSEHDDGFAIFESQLEEMMTYLAKLIISDGEGSSKFIEYDVINAPNEADARKICREISKSSLVKTAMYGRDPNWGRIICAAGNAGVPFDYQQVDLYMGDEKKQIKLLEQGTPLAYDLAFMKKLLRESHLYVRLDMCAGAYSAKACGSDLTVDYVLFNSVYTT